MRHPQLVPAWVCGEGDILLLMPMTSPAVYTIGKFARVSGVSAKTLRFYAEVGVFRPANVNPLTGYRYYIPEQLGELASILALRELGVSLAVIRELNRKAPTGAGRRELLQELRTGLQRSIQTAARSLKWVNAELEQVNDGVRALPVVLKRRPAMPVASVRSKVSSYEEIDRFEEMLLRSVPRAAMAETRGVLWHRCADSGSLEGEPFLELTRRLPSASGYNLRELPAATLACAYSKSDNDSAEMAYDAIRRWIDCRGYKVVGPKREIYLDGALEIQFPVNAV